MSDTRISRQLAACRAENRTAVVFFTECGDPSLDRTVDILLALEQAGADVVELGVPFSDPLADGPSIQAAAHRALGAGASVSTAMETVRKVRESSELPLLLFTYFNPVYSYGLERFAEEAALAGADGVLMVDLTPEEADDWLVAAHSNGLDTVFLLAPTSTQDRIEAVCKISTGFVYCVSRTGVTGVRSEVPTDLPELLNKVKSTTDLPIMVGFGVSEPEHVQSIGALADGAVVGSALVNIIAREGDSAGLIPAVSQFASKLVSAGGR